MNQWRVLLLLTLHRVCLLNLTTQHNCSINSKKTHLESEILFVVI